MTKTRNMHFSALQHTGTLRITCSSDNTFLFPPSQVAYKVSASQDTEREKWKKCIIYLSFFTAPPPLPSGHNYCSTNLTDQPFTTPPLSVWISGLNTEFRKGTRTAAQCRSPTPCSNSPSYSVPVPVPVSVLRNPDSDTVDFVQFPDVADADSPVPTYTRFYTYDFLWVQGYQIADIQLWLGKADTSLALYCGRLVGGHARWNCTIFFVGPPSKTIYIMIVRADRQIIFCFILTKYPYSLQSQLLLLFW